MGKQKYDGIGVPDVNLTRTGTTYIFGELCICICVENFINYQNVTREKLRFVSGLCLINLLIISACANGMAVLPAETP